MRALFDIYYSKIFYNIFGQTLMNGAALAAWPGPSRSLLIIFWEGGSESKYFILKGCRCIFVQSGL